MNKNFFYRWHIDGPLLFTLFLVSMMGLIIIYSATGQNFPQLVKQLSHLLIGFMSLFVLAQVPPRFLERWTPWVFALSLVLLLFVFWIGDRSKGAERWLSIGFFRFQPSELVKLTLPLMLAWVLQQKPLPPRSKEILIVLMLMAFPILLIAEQPDLGTTILVGISGFFALFFAGIPWMFLGILGIFLMFSLPILWFFLHDYQRQRILAFLNPEGDPLGSGWNLIQSKIAIGSGGLTGKGWLHGSQSRLDFLPEGSTDFIFAVWAEEFGFIGVSFLLLLYLAITIRGLYFGVQAQDTFSRVYIGSFAFSFFCYVFINVGMVVGLLPVVGVPLPLFSLGGTSLITLLAGFGILMSLHTHKRLLG